MRIAAVLITLMMFLPNAVLAGDGDKSAAREVLSSHIKKTLESLEEFGGLGSALMLDVPGIGQVTVTAGRNSLRSDEPVAGNDRFFIGSQTKVFTAAAVVRLAKEGKLKLTDPVRKYIPEISEGAADTVKNLLMHTSGFGDGVSYLHRPSRPEKIMTFTFADHLFLSRLAGRKFAAGERYDYNNFGYVLLGELIKRVSGEKSHEAYIKRVFLDPLSMKDTVFSSAGVWDIKHMAHGYSFSTRDNQVEDMAQPHDVTWAGSAGDMISTVGDMMTWLGALIDKDSRVGVSFADLTAEKVSSGHPGWENAYGYGAMFWDFGSIPTIGHGGNIDGYISYGGFDPESGVRFVLLTSTSGEKELRLEMYMQKVVSAIGSILHYARLTEELTRP